MSHLQYFAYKGVGEHNRRKYKYSQAVRVGDRIECAGQGTPHFPKIPSLPTVKTLIKIKGGWDPQTGTIPAETSLQINQAFANVAHNLKDAGGTGWGQVFRVNSYHVPMNEEALECMVRNFKKYMPRHEPIWTCVGVSGLGEEEMRVEIEVSAHVPPGPELDM